MNSLSPRLAAIADWVIPGEPVADIGSDHAGLAIHLLLSGHCPRAIITDINSRPLKRAQSMVDRFGLLERCDFRMGDGLATLEPGEAATICIAGMGGQTIAGIIGAAEVKLPSYERLLLQPMNIFSPLRQFLSRSGYPILRERAVKEEAGCFIILDVGTIAGAPYPLSGLEAEVGPYVLAHPREYDNRYYLERWHQKYGERLNNMAKSSRRQVKQQQGEIREARQRIEEVLAQC